jgi:alcohol dehydrogenase
MWRYRNPVEVKFGAGVFETMGEVLAGRSYCLVTYDDANGGGVFARLTRRVMAMAGEPAVTVRNIGPNPDFLGLEESCRTYAAAAQPVEAIVALGGGSVMDAAKVLAAAAGDFQKVRRHLEAGAGSDQLGRTPIIAIPTTAGTGSEVTSWATVWDTEAKKKYSLAGETLYPETALVDPLLTLGLPRAVTISSGLDALSHALESIWNVNANPVSGALAEVAAREVMDALPLLADDLDNLELRTRLARASLFAGLAFSNTRTALAHALSYHLTLHHGVPHGVACSFSLPMVLRAVAGCDAACDSALKRVFGPDLLTGAVQLEAVLENLGISSDATDHGIAAKDWVRLVDGALSGERGRNFIGRREALLAEVAA